MKKTIIKDVIVIGAGISGLVAAHTASKLGLDTLVIEKNMVGGANISKNVMKGMIFDYGYHALDFNRSKNTTKFFKEMLDSQYNKLKLKRGIVLKNELIEYNSPLKKWPKNLKELFEFEPKEDHITQTITKSKIEKYYGKEFTKFVLNEILFSYPTIKWAFENGSIFEDIIGMAYPWFFPKIKKIRKIEKESEKFHETMRQTSNHYILYPKKGGFGEFINGIERKINKKCKIISNVKKAEFIFDSKNSLEKIIIKNEEFRARKYFWCTSPVILLHHFKKQNIKLKKNIGQKLLLGNFILKEPINSEFHEILVGSIEHKINRISFPGKIQQKQNLQIQIEFLIPENYPELTKKDWKKSWMESLEKIGIITSKNKIIGFDLIKESKGFSSIEKYEKIKRKYVKKIEYILKESNIILPYLNLGPENLNRVIPETKLKVKNSLIPLN